MSESFSIYEEEDHFYCDKAQRNCPFSSQFRYCFGGCPVLDLSDLCKEEPGDARKVFED